MQRLTEKTSSTVRLVIALNGPSRRKELGLSQERVAQRMGKSRETVRAIELGENVTIDSLELYAAALETTVLDIITARYLGRQTIRGGERARAFASA